MLRWVRHIVQLKKLRHVLGKAVKECATVTKEGWRGAQNGHKKTHSLARTHVLDSKVTLTHRERNDGRRERREGTKGRVWRGKKENCHHKKTF